MYGLLYSRVLSRVDAERAHVLGTRALALAARLPRPKADPALRVHALGLSFDSPLGVAAGLDKHATAFEGLGNLGFGFVEVGTITAVAQPGNPRPRVWRLPRDRALMNAMGFPNPGAEAVAPMLARRSGRGIVAINIGKSKVAPLEEAAADYRASAQLLAPHADFVVINVSSPNTTGLRDLQTIEHLRELVAAVRAETDRPVLVKLAPDLTDEQLDQLADFAVEAELDGLIATNTTISRAGLHAPADVLANPGGVSGAPLKHALARRPAAPARAGRRPGAARLGRRRGDGGRRADAHPRGRDARPGLHRLRLRRAAVGAAHQPRARGAPCGRRARRRSRSLSGNEVGVRPGLAHAAPAPAGARD